MTKTWKWRGLLSNVDLTNQKSFVLFFPRKKKERKTIKMFFPLDPLTLNPSSDGLLKIE